MDFLTTGLKAVIDGVDVRDVIALILVCIVVAQLRDIAHIMGRQSEQLDAIGDKIDTHGRHQTARMEEIRRFMLQWWERFAPLQRPRE